MNTDFLKQFGAELDAQNDQPIGQPTSRRAALGQSGKLGLGAAAMAVPFIGMAREVHAAKTGGMFNNRYHGVLDFALTLEYLEYFFYKQAVESGDIPSDALPLFRDIRDHELAHVNLLKAAVQGTDNPATVYEQDDFDYTLGGMFDPFGSGNYESQLLVIAQGFEDTGVRAYKGQAVNLKNDTAPDALDILTVALQIHSVEARHAAAIRTLRGETPYISLNENPAAAIAPAYAGEDVTTQAGINLTTLGSGYSANNAAQAFDEPLTREAVLAIAGPFITGEGDPQTGDP